MAKEKVEAPDPLAFFEAFVDEAVNRAIPSDLNEMASAIDVQLLSAEDLKVQIKLAGRKLLEDSALALGEAAADGLALTMLTVSREGAYAGGFKSKYMDELARVLVGEKE